MIVCSWAACDLTAPLVLRRWLQRLRVDEGDRERTNLAPSRECRAPPNGLPLLVQAANGAMIEPNIGIVATDLRDPTAPSAPLLPARGGAQVARSVDAPLGESLATEH